jgi:hypothetical protein
MPTIDVNGTTLYYERRGEGPPVLFISVFTGDADTSETSRMPWGTSSRL